MPCASMPEGYEDYAEAVRLATGTSSRRRQEPGHRGRDRRKRHAVSTAGSFPRAAQDGASGDIERRLSQSTGARETRLQGRRRTGGLADEGRKEMTDRAGQELAQITANDALVSQRQGEILELLLRQQAREVEIRLAYSPPRISSPVIFDTDLDAGRVATGDGPPPSPDGGVPMHVTYEEQAFRIPPGMPVAEFEADIGRLSSMTEVYRRIHAAHENVILRHYTTLRSGLHSVYPGRGGYPPQYDPRTRPWYRRQIQSPGLAWSAPLVDVVTKEVALGISMPVYGPDGALAGVTGVDVPLTALFSSLPLPSGWAAESRTFAVVAESTPGSPEPALRVLARQSYDAASLDWRAPLSAEWLPVEPPPARAQIMADVAAHRAGMITAPYRGVESLWAYRPLGKDQSTLLLIVPYARAIEHAEATHAMALATTTQQLQVIAAIAVVAAGLVVLVALLSARTVTRPVHHLVEAITRVTRGDLDARAHLDTGDELQHLAEGFNAMVPQLRERLQ